LDDHQVISLASFHPPSQAAQDYLDFSLDQVSPKAQPLFEIPPPAPQQIPNQAPLQTFLETESLGPESWITTNDIDALLQNIDASLGTADHEHASSSTPSISDLILLDKEFDWDEIAKDMLAM
jgi:hypothetical protein